MYESHKPHDFIPVKVHFSEIVRETEKGIQVKTAFGETWFPKDYVELDRANHILKAPKWLYLAKKKDAITRRTKKVMNRLARTYKRKAIQGKLHKKSA